MLKEISDGLAPMFKEAREKGLWFHGSYHDLWYSPDDLAEAQANGSMRWGAGNWKLLDPKIQLEHLSRQAQSAAQAYNDFHLKLMKLENDTAPAAERVRRTGTPTMKIDKVKTEVVPEICYCLRNSHIPGSKQKCRFAKSWKELKLFSEQRPVELIKALGQLQLLIDANATLIAEWRTSYSGETHQVASDFADELEAATKEATG